MAQKLIATKKEIKQDVMHAVGQIKSSSSKSYKKQTVICAVIALPLIVFEFIYPLLIAWLICGAMAVAVIYIVTIPLRITIREKLVSLDDYEITTETVSHTHYETYEIVDLQKSTAVQNSVIFFENQKKWQIPERIYRWTPEGGMCCWHIYDNTHRGDKMVVVSKKRSGEIVVAYHTDFFEYKEAP